MTPVVTVVLPCAGSGSRMGLPFPKELAPLGPGRVVIDSCLDLIGAAAESSPVRVLLMDDGQRGQTEARIAARLPSVPLARVRQAPEAADMTDAVLRLEPWLSTVNVLLLPDAVYEAEGDPVGDVAEAAKSFGFAFGAVAEDDPERLSGLGALRFEEGRVVAYEDKPERSWYYNAAWVMLGFTNGRFGLDWLRLIRASAEKTVPGPVVIPAPPCPVTWVKGYRDCGTWDSYAAEVAGSGA